MRWGIVLSVFKTRAVVIKTQDIKENDKLVWLFSEKLGRISTIAKGSKKGRSKLLPTTQQFCYGEYIVFKGKSLYTINEVEIIDSFQGLLKNLDSIIYASYLCELVDICSGEEESHRELFKSFVTAFYLMKNNACDFEALARAFEVRILAMTGYSLCLDYCSSCRKKITSSNYIRLDLLGGVCSECDKINGSYISLSAYQALRFLSKIPFQNLYRLTLTKETKEELYKITSYIISQNYLRKPKSLEALNFLKNIDN